MSKSVLDVGNCGPDHSSIRTLLESQFGAQVCQADDWDSAARQLETQSVDLILVNRLLDRDGSQGLDVIRELKAHPKFRTIPVMLISNYEDHQQAAVDAGAEPGFGKLALRDSETTSRLSLFLGGQ